jgi:hypothetical protein
MHFQKKEKISAISISHFQHCYISIQRIHLITVETLVNHSRVSFPSLIRYVYLLQIQCVSLMSVGAKAPSTNYIARVRRRGRIEALYASEEEDDQFAEQRFSLRCGTAKTTWRSKFSSTFLTRRTGPEDRKTFQKRGFFQKHCRFCIESNFEHGICGIEISKILVEPYTVCQKLQKECTPERTPGTSASPGQQQGLNPHPPTNSTSQRLHDPANAIGSEGSSSLFSQIPTPSKCSPATAQTTSLSIPLSQQESNVARRPGDTGQFKSHNSARNNVISRSQGLTSAFNINTSPSQPLLATGFLQGPNAGTLNMFQSTASLSQLTLSQYAASSSGFDPYGWLSSSSAFPTNHSLGSHDFRQPSAAPNAVSSKMFQPTTNHPSLAVPQFPASNSGVSPSGSSSSNFASLANGSLGFRQKTREGNATSSSSMLQSSTNPLSYLCPKISSRV